MGVICRLDILTLEWAVAQPLTKLCYLEIFFYFCMKSDFMVSMFVSSASIRWVRRMTDYLLMKLSRLPQLSL